MQILRTKLGLPFAFDFQLHEDGGPMDISSYDIFVKVGGKIHNGSDIGNGIVRIILEKEDVVLGIHDVEVTASSTRETMVVGVTKLIVDG